METYGGNPTVECEWCGDDVGFGMGNRYARAMKKKFSDEETFLCRECKTTCRSCGEDKYENENTGEVFCPVCDDV